MSWSQNEIPEVDETREWLGHEYADVVIAEFQKNNPNVKLVIDLEAMGMDKMDYSIKDRLKETMAWIKHPDFKDHPLSFKLFEIVRTILPSKFSDLLYSLEFGEPLHLRYYESNSLKSWVLAQPEKSIYPHQLMAKSLEFSKGYIISAWIRAWNLMSEGWSATSTRNYDNLRSRFASLTGERHLWNGGVAFIVIPQSERQSGEALVSDHDGNKRKVKSERNMKMVVSKRGDEFSYIYHRIGVELLSIVVSKVMGQSLIGKVSGRIGGLAEWLKYPQTAGLAVESRKRVGNDLLAADSGSRIYDIVERNAKLVIEQHQINPRYYLRSNPKKFNSTYIVTDERPAFYHRSKVDPKFWAPSMSAEELILRFYHATRYDEKIMSPLLLAANGDYERLHRGLVDYMEGNLRNDKLNEYISDYIRGMRGSPLKPDVAFQDVNFGIERDGWNDYYARQIDQNFQFNKITESIDRLLVRVIAKTSKYTSKQTDSTGSNAPRLCRKILRGN